MAPAVNTGIPNSLCESLLLMRNDTIDWEIKLKPKDSKQKSPYLSFNIEENRNEYTYVCYNLCPWTKNDTCQEP